MPSLPSGTVTFFFSDIEGSTRLLRRLGDDYPGVLKTHSQIIRGVLSQTGGIEVSTEGDSFFCVFVSAPQAVAAAVETTKALAAFEWPSDLKVLVRIGIHTGEGVLAGDGYVGLDVHRAARIAASGHGGQVVLSEETSALASRALPSDVSVRDLGRHVLKDLPGPEHLFDLVVEDLPSEFPLLRSLEARPNNLPVVLTNFVGRSAELGTLEELLLGSRLVTLVGPGGTGKTRLAVEVAGGLLDRFPDGVWLTQLQPLADPNLVPQAVASAMQMREQPGVDLSGTIADTVGSQTVLLLLDNCEHLARSPAALAEDLLQRCPNLHVLATSRQPLGVSGESLHSLLGLRVPHLEPVPPLEELAGHEAIQLFVDRASQKKRGFTLTAENALPVAHICARLDGLPLAIELAASRITVLDVTQIQERLEDRFTLLARADTGDSSRQQTLRVTMDWSYDLLSGQEAELLRCASVFSGSLSVNAAEAVCSGENNPLAQILDVLQQLVEKSLLIKDDHPGHTRYRMLETVSDYARDKLNQADEDRLRLSHAEFFVALGEETEPDLAGSGQSAAQLAALDRMDIDHSNLRAALSFLAITEPEQSLRLAGAIWRFWEIRGYLNEGSEFLHHALAAGQDASLEARAKALDGAGRIAWRQGAFNEAAPHFEESLKLWRQMGDPAGEADSLHGLSRAALNLGDHRRAQERAEESLEIQTQLESRQGIATAVNTLGEVARFQGDYDTAQTRYSESLSIYREIGDTAASVTVLHNLAYTELNQGDVTRAEQLFREALTVATELGDQLGIFSMVGGLAAVASVQGQPARAAVLFGAADAIGRLGGYAGDRIDQIEIGQRLTATRQTLGVEAFESAWLQGHALAQQEAIEAALSN